MSLHDNRYLRSFRGHTDRVVALEMSPKEDFFASASLDGAARIWDARTTTCQGVMRFAVAGHYSAVAFDPHGLVFAAAISGGRVKARALSNAGLASASRAYNRVLAPSRLLMPSCAALRSSLMCEPTTKGHS